MRFDPPVWVGRLDGREVRRRTREACLRGLRRLAGGDALLSVEVTPQLVGVSEAAAILGWDRRRVATYVSRGAFPEPVAARQTCPTAGTPCPVTSEEENGPLVRRYLEEAYNGHNLAVISDLLAHDFVRHSVGSPHHNQASGNTDDAARRGVASARQR